MKLENEFLSPIGMAPTWATLTDLRRVVECVPGATLDEVGVDGFTGSVSVRLGPMSMVYAGTGQFIEQDQQAGRLVLRGTARERRGLGTLQARATLTLHPDAGGTRCVLITDLEITGRPAQFGRGMIQDVSDKLIGRFATNLAEHLAGPSSSDARPPDQLDLADLVTGPMVKRAGLVLAAALMVAGFVTWFLRRSGGDRIG